MEESDDTMDESSDEMGPMLNYNDKIPGDELCKLGKEFGENDIDANTTNIHNEYTTKMLLLFFPF